MSTASVSSAPPDSQLPQDRLSRQLGVVSLTALLVGLAIGSGIFRVPSTVAAQIGSVGGVAIIWVAGALVALAGALPIVAVTTALPRSGGTYVFLREAYSPLVGFLYGWVKMFVTGPAALAALALIFAEYTKSFATLTDGQVHLIAGGLIIALTLANAGSVRWGVALQTASTAAKVIALALLAVLIFALGDSAHGAFAHPVAWSGVTMSSFFTALIAVLFTYTGWMEFTYVAGEVKDPVRTYPRALFIGMAIIVPIYLIINTAYLYTLPLPVMAKSSLVAATAASGPLGSRGAAFVSALVMLSTFGALNGSVMASPRVWYAMANDGILIRMIGAVHPRRHTPYVALLLNMSLGLVAVFTHTFEQLTRTFVLGRWPFITLAVATVFLVPRRRPELAALCRSWGYPWVPAAFVLFSLAMLTNELLRRPADLLPSLVIVAVGVVVYYGSRAVTAWRTTARSPAHGAARP
ncbi:MAG TPA: amino acid permease [Gemmatimonadaceae bacterium]|nr:amino acid permease [Gemmatimonadaceae bacterium]